MTDIERLKATKDFLREKYQEDLKKCKHPELKPLIKKTYHENKKAFDVAISALEKQIPTKPNISGTRATVCPSCNRFIDRHEQKHGNIDIPCCKWCGQALDWSDTE